MTIVVDDLLSIVTSVSAVTTHPLSTDTHSLDFLIGAGVPIDVPDTRTAEEVHAAAMARGADCTRCPLYGCRRGPVMSTIRPGAPLLALAEAPGTNEVKQGENLVGKTGQVMDEQLAAGGNPREQTSLVNVLLCRQATDLGLKDWLKIQKAKHDKTILAHRDALKRAAAGEHVGADELETPEDFILPQECCAPRLARDLQEAAPNTILAMGEFALKGVAGYFDIPYGGARKAKHGEVQIISLKKQIGQPVIVPDRVAALCIGLTDTGLVVEAEACAGPKEVTVRGATIVASYHPAFAMRKGGRQFMPVVKTHIKRAAIIATRGGVPEWRALPAEQLHIFPTVEEVEWFCDTLLKYPQTITSDIETSDIHIPSLKLLCVGIGGRLPPTEVLPGRAALALDQESKWPLRIMVVPIRFQGDTQDWWSNPESKLRVVAALKRLCNAPGIIEIRGHNWVNFDSHVLLTREILDDWTRPFNDSLLKHKNTPSNDLPHSLGFCTAEKFDAPAWKDDANDKYVEEVNDENLHVYCGKDVHATHLLGEQLDKQILEHNTWPQDQVDQAVAPHYRNMTNLGMVIDRAEYETMITTVRKKIDGDADKTGNDEHSLELRDGLINTVKRLVGDSNFNIRSTPSVRKFLYETKGLMPVYVGKKDEEFDLKKKPNEEDVDDALKDPSTSIGALLALYDLNPDKQTKDFINKVLEFRAWDKLRGTYLEGLYKEKGNRGKKHAAIDVEDWSHLGPEYADPLHVLHVTYKLMIPTGRASTSPNIQAFPERGKANMKKIFTAPPGHVYVVTDLKQVELRIYAAVSGDLALREAFALNLDAHAWNYATMIAKNPGDRSELQLIYNEIEALKVTSPKKRKGLRNIAKRFGFLLLYGGEDEKLYQTMVSDRDKATNELMFPDLKIEDVQRWTEAWHKGHPETKAWQKACLNMYYETGYAQSLFDFRKRFFPGGLNKRNAVANMTIQSSSAAITNGAVIRIAQQFPHRGWSPLSGLVAQIHDSLTLCAPIGRAEEAAQILHKEFRAEYNGMVFDADKPKWHRNWAIACSD